MKLRDKIILSILAFAAFCWIIYLVKSALTPFIFSLIIAYFLNPLVNYATRKYKLSRLAATSLVLGLFCSILISACTILLPIIYAQFLSLINAVPHYFQTIVNDFYPKIAANLEKFGFKSHVDFSDLLAEEAFNSKLIAFSQNILNGAVNSSSTILGIFSLIFVAPVLIFYLLKDWNILLNKIQNYLPRTIVQTVNTLGREIDESLSHYIRGQFTVCVILGLIYAILLTVSGLNFGFLIGFLTGFFSFIPYVGMLCGVAAATIVGLFQWGFDINHVIVITLVFVFGQIVESNFLTPNLIGSKIGIHPVWIIFGLFFFGTLFGFIGILVAVPLTAICGTVIKHFAAKYKKRFT